jgi:REP element-mobilizing transposase RayT
VPRKRRIDGPGTIHHVWARGVLKRPIFVDDRDRSQLRDVLSATLVEAGARALAWAFMSNHFHIVVRSGPVHLSIVMQFVLSEYARLFNLRHDRVGHLFQGRFGSRIVTGDLGLAKAVRYVHLNPLVPQGVGDLAGLADYPWCGHGALAGRRPPLPFEDVDASVGLLGTREALETWMMSSPRMRAPLDAFEALLEEVCRDLCVDRMAVLAGGRTKDDCSARRTVCVRAVRELKLARSEVARRLEISPAAVTQALARERAI